MVKRKGYGAKKYEEYYGEEYVSRKRRKERINHLTKNFGPYVNCPECGAFLKIDSEGLSGARQINVKVKCSKCGFEEHGLKIDY